MQKIRESDGCVIVQKEFAMNVCRLGQMEACCAFLVAGNGLECARMVSQNITDTILFKVKTKVFLSQGLGGWKNCLWEKELNGRVIDEQKGKTHPG